MNRLPGMISAGESLSCKSICSESPLADSPVQLAELAGIRNRVADAEGDTAT